MKKKTKNFKIFQNQAEIQVTRRRNVHSTREIFQD